MRFLLLVLGVLALVGIVLLLRRGAPGATATSSATEADQARGSADLDALGYPSDRASIPLSIRGRVRGRAVAFDGRPLAGIHVSLLRAGALLSLAPVHDRARHALEVFTRREFDGANFEFDSLPPGEYALESSAECLAPALSAPFELAGENPEIEMRLSLGGSVSGLLLDGITRAPCAGATVTALPASFEPPDLPTFDLGQSIARSDDDGYFLLEALAPSRYGLWIEAPGRAGSFIGDVRVSEGEETILARVILSRGALLNGVVLGPDGQPVAGARVCLTPTDLAAPCMARCASADSAGRYLIQDVSPGTYEVSAHREGDGPPPDPFEALWEINQSKKDLVAKEGAAHEISLALPAPRR